MWNNILLNIFKDTLKLLKIIKKYVICIWMRLKLMLKVEKKFVIIL